MPCGILGSATRKSQRELIRELLDSVPNAYPPSPDWLVAFLLSSARFVRASAPLRRKAARPPVVLSPAKFAPSPAFAGLDVPKLATPGDLAKWLDVSVEQLDWLADSRHQHVNTAIPVLQHYFYTFIPKRAGPPRLIEAPKPRLMAMQRRILREILDLAPVHDRAHGFVQGRSSLSAAQMHAGEFAVVTVDLRDFFAATRVSRVHGICRSLGYPWAVAQALTRLCTASTPAAVFTQTYDGRLHDWWTRKRYASPHLPQGAPTSPALANLCAWRLDQRMAGLARSVGAQYTRYADDLAFSGDAAFARKIKGFLASVEHIACDEGFGVNARKTRIMLQSGCQRITGIVVNRHLNIPRAAYDELKAILHNCAKNGPQTQNRNGLPDFRAHLDGRVHWGETVNPRRGARLRQLFDAIAW